MKGPQISGERPAYQTPEEAASSIKNQLIEDTIVNDLIDSQIKIKFDPSAVASSTYVQIEDPANKKKIDRRALDIFKKAYDVATNEIPRLANIELQRWIKLYNPTDDFQKYLRTPYAKETSDANFFKKIFNFDMGIFRNAALDGLKEVIAGTAETVGDPNASIEMDSLRALGVPMNPQETNQLEPFTLGGVARIKRNLDYDHQIGRDALNRTIPGTEQIATGNLAKQIVPPEVLEGIEEGFQGNIEDRLMKSLTTGPGLIDISRLPRE